MIRKVVLVLLTMHGYVYVCNAQSTVDLQKIDSVVHLFYERVSFSDSQWKNAEELIPLFFTDARIIANFGQTPQVSDVTQYIAAVRSNISKQGVRSVTEIEIYSKTDVFGKVAQRLSTYEIRFVFREKDPLVRRGINLLQLVNVGGTWKVNAILWDRESEQLKIPSQYLQK